VNRVLRVLGPTPAGRLLPASVALLRFTGRTSGRRLEVPVLVHEFEGTEAVFTSAPWRRNFDGGAPVTVVRKGRAVAHRGELVTDQAQVAPALQEAVRRKGAGKLGLAATKGRQPTVDELAAVGKSMIRLRRA
jgi:hypothetical protein